MRGVGFYIPEAYKYTGSLLYACGNNFGYFPFSVVKANALPFRNGVNSTDIALTIDGMSMREFITYAARQPAPFDAECVISNKGGTPLHTVLELDMIDANDKRVESFSHNIGIIQGGETNVRIGSSSSGDLPL